MLDAKVVRGMFEGSDHYILSAKIKIKGRWVYSWKNGKGKVSKVLSSGRMNRKEDREEYERMVCEKQKREKVFVRYSGCSKVQ